MRDYGDDGKYYEDDEEGEKYPKDDDVDGDEWQKEDNGDYNKSGGDDDVDITKHNSLRIVDHCLN